MSEPLRVVSAGLGHQSTALIIACVMGEPGFPRIDLAAFADTGSELDATYAHRDRFALWMERRGVPLVTVKKNDESGSLRQSILDRIAGLRVSASPIPVWLENGGRALQGCTRDWKMRPLDSYYKKVAKERGAKAVEVCIGYGVEEFGRVPSPAKYGWPEGWSPRYPLIENGWDRGRSVAYIKRHLGWEVVSSCCKICPHRPAVGPGSFASIPRPSSDWDEVVAFDAAIRDGTAFGLRDRVYLTKHRAPVADAIRSELAQGRFEFAGGEPMSCDGSVCFV